MAVRTTSATASDSNWPDTVTVTTTADRVVWSNPDRRSLIIQNTSAVVIYIGYGRGLTTANGIQLAPGDSLVEQIYTGDVYALAASGSQVLPYIEVHI